MRKEEEPTNLLQPEQMITRMAINDTRKLSRIGELDELDIDGSTETKDQST